MTKTFLIFATALLLFPALAQARGRDYREVHVIAPAPLQVTGYPPRFGPAPYYDANYVYGVDGFNPFYYDGWRTRTAFGPYVCESFGYHHIVRRGRIVSVQSYCVE